MEIMEAYGTCLREAIRWMIQISLEDSAIAFMRVLIDGTIMDASNNWQHIFQGTWWRKFGNPRLTNEGIPILIGS
jgi:hypothetical protein